MFKNPKPTFESYRRKDKPGDETGIFLGIKFGVEDFHRLDGGPGDPDPGGPIGFGDGSRFPAQSGGGALEVNGTDFGIINDFKAGFVKAVAEVDVLTVKIVSLVPTADLVKKLGGHQQK